jgi:opacity protein-like surface antigen
MNLLTARPITRLVVLAAMLCLPLASPLPAAAEWFADVYAGLSSTKDGNVKLDDNGTLRLKDVEFDNSMTYGGRFGHYLVSVPWIGFALDGMNYDANIGKQSAALKDTSVRAQLAPMDISVIAISLDLMLRLPLLATPEIPGGRVTPYVLAGPGLFVARAADRGNFIRRHQDDHDVALGYNVGGGVGWQFSKALGVFGEYRYTHAKPEFEFLNVDSRATVETNLNTHHFLVGLSVRF